MTKIILALFLSPSARLGDYDWLSRYCHLANEPLLTTNLSYRICGCFFWIQQVLYRTSERGTYRNSNFQFVSNCFSSFEHFNKAICNLEVQSVVSGTEIETFKLFEDIDRLHTEYAVEFTFRFHLNSILVDLLLIHCQRIIDSKPSDQ